VIKKKVKDLEPWKSSPNHTLRTFAVTPELARRIDRAIAKSSARFWGEWAFKIFERKAEEILEGKSWLDSLSPAVREQALREYPKGTAAPWQRQMRQSSKGVYFDEESLAKIDTALTSNACEATSWGQWAWGTIADAVERQENGEPWLGDVERDRAEALREGIKSLILQQGIADLSKRTGIPAERLKEIYEDPCLIKKEEYDLLGVEEEWFELS